MPPPTPLAWRRHWSKRGEKPAMRNGYLWPSAEKTTENEEDTSYLSLLLGAGPNAVSFEKITHIPFLVLLGDVGLGKSTVLRAEADRLRAQLAGDTAHQCLWLDLKGKTEAIISRGLFDSPEFKAWSQGTSELTVFLDSLDECWRHLAQLTEVLATGLELAVESKRPALRLRLACRPGEWHADLEDRLRSVARKLGLNPDEAISVRVLASLSEVDVRLTAIAHAVDPDEFMRQVAERDLEVLAGQPMTLFMLLDEFALGQGLPPSAVELYARGCLRLCEDPHAQSGSSPRLQTTAAERLVWAGRLAAAAIFGNRQLINANPDSVSFRSGVLELSELSPGTGAVDRAALAETLHTGIFSEAEQNLQDWRHSSYAEFLAAHHVHAAKLPIEALVNLLTVPLDGAPRVPAQLAEVTRWLMEMDPRIFPALYQANPEIVLRCNRLWFTDDRRTRLAKAYLAAIAANQLQMDAGGEGRTKLAHAGLAQQVRPVFRDATQTTRVRISALDVGRLCCGNEIWRDALALLIDPNTPLRLRTNCAVVLSDLPRADLGPELLQAAPPETVAKWDVELIGFYLQRLWPDHLTFQQVVTLLRPPRHNMIGSYEIFFDQQLIKSLPPADLLNALQWLNQCRRQNSFSLDYEAIRKLVRLAFTRVAEPAIRSEVVTLLLSAQHGENFLTNEEREERRVPISVEARRLLWPELVAGALEVSDLALDGQYAECGLLAPEDVAWFADRARADPVKLTAWLWLFQQAFNRSQGDNWPVAEAMAKDYPSIATWLDRQRTCDLRPWRQPPPVPTAPPPLPIAQRAEVALVRFENGETIQLAYVFYIILHDRSAIAPPDGIWQHEGWTSLDVRQIARVRAGIPRFLNEFVPPVLGRGSYNQAAMAGLHFLALEAGLNPPLLESLAPAVWQRWLPPLLTYESISRLSHLAVWPSLLRQAWRAAPAEGLATLKALVTAHEKDGTLPSVLTQAPAELADLEALCIDFLSSARDPRFAIQSVDQVLSPRRSTLWRNWLESTASTTSAQQCDRFAVAATATLLETEPETRHAAILARAYADPLWGQALVRALARHPHRAGWLNKIPAAELLKFSEWIKAQFPGDPYFDREDDDGTHGWKHAVYDFRMAVFGTVRSRTTLEAIAAINDFMAQQLPDRFWLGDTLAEMRHNCRNAVWAPIAPGELAKYIAHPVFPPLTDEGNLYRAAQISLDRFQQTLRVENPSHELWNKVTAGNNTYHWSPKDEKELRDRLLRHLRLELGPAGVSATSESENLGAHGNATAEELDIQLTLPLAGKPHAHVVIEVKGTWNRGLLDDLKGQLVNRYLAHHRSDHGLYVAMHFGCASWNQPNDSRKTANWANEDKDEVLRLLREKLKQTDCHGKTVDVMVIDGRIGK